MDRILVSVVIPVYNVAPYVEQCLKSVLNQTYDNIEIIVVDDCGTDDSMTIVERIKEEYKGNKTFKIIHHEHNRGLSAARNTGMHFANGNYLFFLDSDDTITNDCISLMAEKANMDPNIEMVMGQIHQVGGYQAMGPFLSDGFQEGDFIKHACEYKIYTMAWNKLLRKDFLLSNNLFFVEGLYHEDVLWNFQVACCLKKMYAIPEQTYNYLIRDTSIQRKDSQEFHDVHNSQVYINMLDYIGTKKLKNNRLIYDYITHDFNRYLLNPLWENNPDQSWDFYLRLRGVKYWSLMELLEMKCNIIDYIWWIGSILPLNIAYKLVVKVISKQICQ